MPEREDKLSFDAVFRKAPRELRERYRRFRATHPAKRIRFSQTDWEYVSCGSGDQALLLLAGGARFADAWHGLILELEPDYRIIATTDPGVSTISELVEGTMAVLDAEAIERAHVVGTSLGGLLAQCLVRAHCDRVGHLVLSNTLAPSAIPRKWAALALKIARLYPTRFLQSSVQWNMRLIMSTTPSNRAFWKAYWAWKGRGRLRSMTREAVLGQYQVFLDVATNYRFTADDLEAWAGRVLLIESENDIGYIRRAAPGLRDLYPGAEVHRFPDAGHTPGYSQPEAYAQVIRSFLEG